MQFKQGAQVVVPDHGEVGRVERVVLDPETKQVTHIVVRRGKLLPEERVVPMALVASATGEQVTLHKGASDLDKLPQFEERQYVSMDEPEAGPGPLGYAPPFYWKMPIVTEVDKNIPKGTVALREGAKVFSSDGQEVGRIEQIVTAPPGDEATHFVIEPKGASQEFKRIPLTWVERVEEDEVYLTVGSRLIEDLDEDESGS